MYKIWTRTGKAAQFLRILIFSLLISAALSHAQDYRVDVEPKSGSSDDTFTLNISISAENAQSYGAISFENSDYFNLSSQGQASKIQILNGFQTSELVYQFGFTCKSNLAPGTYKLPNARFSNKQDLLIQGPNIEIRKAQTVPVDIVQTTGTLSPYLGQQLDYKVEIAAATKIVDANLQDIKFKDFWQESYGDQKQTKRELSNNITVFTVKEALFPLKTGTLNIPERTLTTAVYEINPNRRNRSWTIFDELAPGLSMRNDYRQKNITRTAKAITLNVRPLPEAPFEYSNYVPVGNTFADSKIDKSELELGDSVNLSITIQSDGNLRPLELPKISGDSVDSFTIYSDKAEIKTYIKNNKIFFEKKFSIALVPKEAGKLKLPTYQFLFFDPAKESYTKFVSENVFLDVKQGSADNALITSENKDSKQLEEVDEKKKEISLISEDILPQHKSTRSLEKKRTFSNGTLIFLTLLGPLLTLATWLIFARKNTDSEYLNYKHAQANADRALSNAKSANELAEAYRDYLSSRLFKNVRSYTPHELSLLIERATSDTALASSAKKLLQNFEHLQYAGANLAESKFDELRLELNQLVQKIDDKTREYKKLKSLLLISLLVSSMFFAQTAGALKKFDITSLIRKADHSYERGDYLDALVNYQSAIKAGLDGGDVHYNLANTYLRLKQYGKAIYHYKIAQQDLPRDPDIQANLNYARKQTKDKIEEGPKNFSYILNQALSLRKNISRYEAERIWTLLYLAFWTALSFYILFKPPLLKNIIYLLFPLTLWWSACTFLTQTNRLGEQTFALNRDLRSAVIGVPEAEVYSGDSKTYQVIFVLHDGAEVLITDQRDEWYELELPDGKKGWLEQKNIEIL